MTNSQLDTTNESQEVSPFPAGDHKAQLNRHTQRHSEHKTEQKHKRSTKEDFTTAGDWDCVAAVERLPDLHYSVDFIFLSFVIMGFIVEL